MSQTPPVVIKKSVPATKQSDEPHHIKCASNYATLPTVVSITDVSYHTYRFTIPPNETDKVITGHKDGMLLYSVTIDDTLGDVCHYVCGAGDVVIQNKADVAREVTLSWCV